MEIVTKRLEELRPDPRNPRAHGEENMAAIVASLRRFGQAEALVLQRGTGRVVAGHGRLEAMKLLGWETCEVIELDIDDRTAAALAVTLNRSGELGRWHEETLTKLLVELRDDFGIEGLGFSNEQIDELIYDLEVENAPVLEDPGALEPPEVPTSCSGDLWILGRHRLLVGNSTSEQDVRRVLAGTKPFMMLTDPPYGVLYDPAWRNEAGLASTERTGRVTNDERCDWSEAWSLFPGDVAYVWHAGKFAAEVAQSLAKTGFEVRAQLIWSKPRFAISRGHYHWQHEPCYYAVREGRTSKWCGDRTQSTVWEVEPDRDIDVSDHGTPKPLELFLRPMRNHGGADDDIYEPFCGTGTAVVAAQQLHRRCFALEIEPRYCDAIVRRWEIATKLEAKLEDGRSFAEVAAKRSAEPAT